MKRRTLRQNSRHAEVSAWVEQAEETLFDRFRIKLPQRGKRAYGSRAEYSAALKWRFIFGRQRAA